MSIFLIVIFLLSNFSSATYISLTTQISTEELIYGNKTSIEIGLTNGGDEIAHDVKLSLILPEGFSEKTGLLLGNLAPNVPSEGVLTVSVEDSVLPGEYAMGILTEYKDANGYPFSSVSPTVLFVKEKVVSSKVRGTLDKIEVALEGRKKSKLKIRNTDSKERTVKATLFLPYELVSDEYEREVTLLPRTDSEIFFEISPFGALSGSTYVVFCVLSYEDSGVHYSSVSSGIVTVTDKKEDSPFFSLPDVSSWIPGAALVILIFIFIAYQFVQKKNKNDDEDEED